MSCFLYPTTFPSSLSIPNPNPNPFSIPTLCPDSSFQFPSFERDYMGLGLCITPEISAALATHGTFIHKSSLADPSPNDDLCGSHLKLAPPSSVTDDNVQGGDADDGEPLSANIGWPPISSYRKSTTRALSIRPACSSIETTAPLIVHEAPLEESSCINKNIDEDKQEPSSIMKTSLRKPLHIKVSMDGTPIMRKLDLETMQGYQHLSLELHKLFKFYKRGHFSCEVGVHSYCFKDLNGASFILTYKDRDGDWMLVGDTPWESFAESARRIRIMKKTK